MTSASKAPTFLMLASIAAVVASAQPEPAAGQGANGRSTKAASAKKDKAQATKAKAAPSAKSTAKPKGESKPAQPAAAAAASTTVKVALTTKEAQHIARYDAAIKAVREHELSAQDAARLREAVEAIAAGKVPQANTLRDRISDAVGRKLVDWYAYRGGYGTASDIRAFLDANPSWPDRDLLTRRAEEILFSTAPPAREVRAFFATAPPKSGAGIAALAAALLAEKDEANAKALAAKAWVQHDFSTNLEAEFLKRLGGLLTEEDHKKRLDRLLLEDSRWTRERAERAVVIRRVIARLSPAEKKKAEARLAVYLRNKNAGKLIAALPADAQGDWGVAFHKAQVLRRQNKDEEAWKILLTEPKEAPLLVKPEGWWEERRAAAYAALKARKPQLAYDLVRDPGPLAVNAAKDAAFLAGWLALRYLSDAKAALPHFEQLARTADGPLSKARGHYWTGRAHEALGDLEKARESYRAASVFYDTFHGLLARQKLDPDSSHLELEPPAAPTEAQVARLNELDSVKAAVIAYKANLGASLVRSFFIHLRHHLQTEEEVAMVAHLAESLGDTQMAVRIGKSAIARGMNLVYYAYPIHSLPAYTPLRRPPEPAMVLGIARQESEFNSLTLSGAGARGILQVMPITARHVCRDYKLKCDIARLMKDPAYNTMMGSAYISDRMDEFSGSYVLTLAGYNAGPGRARQWIAEFGDPRDGKVDPIDWIHRIPFEETRDYVQKVLSNIQIYRARLGDEANAVRLEADLRRSSIASASKEADAKRRSATTK